MSFVQDLYVNNTLNVTGLSTHAGNMAVTGTSTLTGDVTMSANAVIVGNLDVQGTTTSIDSVNVNIADRHMYLNKDYVTESGESGGLVVNYLPTGTNDTVAAGGFPTTTTIATTGASVFLAGDIIQISSALNVDNDGIFIVLTHAANVLTINSTSDFAQTAFTVDTTDPSGATLIRKVNVSIMQTNAAGAWETTFGANTADITTNSKSILLSGGASSSTSLTLSDDTNQLVFSHTQSGTESTTLNVVEPATALTITLPDPGGAANIILSAGTQDMSGAYTVASGGSFTIDTAATLVLDDTTGDHTYTFEVSELTANRVITLPPLTDADTFVFEDHAQTLTNKIIIEGVTSRLFSAGPFTLTNTDDTVQVVTGAGTATINLPALPTDGIKFTIINFMTADNVLTIVAGGGKTIDDGVLTTIDLAKRNQRFTIQYIDAANNWYIV